MDIQCVLLLKSLREPRQARLSDCSVWKEGRGERMSQEWRRDAKGRWCGWGEDEEGEEGEKEETRGGGEG